MLNFTIPINYMELKNQAHSNWTYSRVHLVLNPSQPRPSAKGYYDDGEARHPEWGRGYLHLLRGCMGTPQCWGSLWRQGGGTPSLMRDEVFSLTHSLTPELCAHALGDPNQCWRRQGDSNIPNVVHRVRGRCFPFFFLKELLLRTLNSHRFTLLIFVIV